MLSVFSSGSSVACFRAFSANAEQARRADSIVPFVINIIDPDSIPVANETADSVRLA
jgi:hypothetical protein